MEIKQIYTNCLAQGAYFIHSKGEAVVIDPLREIDEYLALAKEANVKIKYIFETHFHADFVSGHISLAEKTGAKIVFGPNATPSYDAYVAKDGESFQIGDLTLEVLHTPGHTMESSTFLLKDENGNDHSIYTGDTLFLGDVGRPDLAQKAGELTTEDLAGHLYDSLRTKIMPLSDGVIVYPGHGAGSACGKNMSSDTVDTLGNQKKNNYALAEDLSKEDFIKELTFGLETPPAYFPDNVAMNKNGYQDIDQVLAKGNHGLTVDEFALMVDKHDVLVLDVRTKTDFVKSHVPESIFIGLDGKFAPWVGELLADTKQPLLLVVNEGQEEEAVTRLARIGFDNLLGYLRGGVSAWEDGGRELDHVEQVDASKLAVIYPNLNDQILDVRKEGEYLSQHVESALLVPLTHLKKNQVNVDESKKSFIHCASGYRSVIAISILKKRGIHNVVDVAGGFKALKETTIPMTNYVCPSEL